MRPIFWIPVTCITLGAQISSYQPRVDLKEGRFLQALTEAEIRLASNENDALAWASKSQALISLVRLREAEEAAERALKLNSGLPDALVARAMISAGKALQQINLGSLKMASKAMNDLREAVKSDADYPLAWQTLAISYQLLPGVFGGSTKKALECVEQVKRITPARGHALHGRILSLDSKWNQAEPIFNLALEMVPNDTEIVSAYLESLSGSNTTKTLGETLQKQKLVSEARRLLPLVQKKARGIEAVSQALLVAGQNEEAWKVAFDAVSLVEAPSIVKLQLGKVAARTGINKEEGLAFLDQAAKEPLEGGTGGYASVHWRRGQILYAMDRRDEARTAVRRALTFNPNHKGAKELLAQL